jgi:hypothetical protein
LKNHSNNTQKFQEQILAIKCTHIGAHHIIPHSLSTHTHADIAAAKDPSWVRDISHSQTGNIIRSKNTTKTNVRCQCLQPGSPGVRHCKTAQELNGPVEIFLARKGSFETHFFFCIFYIYMFMK